MRREQLISLSPAQTSEYVYIPTTLSQDYLEGVPRRTLGQDVTIQNGGTASPQPRRAPEQPALDALAEPVCVSDAFPRACCQAQLGGAVYAGAGAPAVGAGGA